MNIRRAIALVFFARAALLGAGCDRGPVGVGDLCDDGYGGCNSLYPGCAAGLSCSAVTGRCQVCDYDTDQNCASTCAPGDSLCSQGGGGGGVGACEPVDDAAVCGDNGEQLVHCALDTSPGGDCYALESSGNSGDWCCLPAPATCNACDASTDAADDVSDAEPIDADASDQ